MVSSVISLPGHVHLWGLPHLPPKDPDSLLHHVEGLLHVGHTWAETLLLVTEEAWQQTVLWSRMGERGKGRETAS